MGEVYLAHDPRLDRTVALKITFAQNPKATRHAMSATLAIPVGHLGPRPAVRSIIHLQRTIGNRAVQQMLQTPLHPAATRAIQMKLAINEPGDRYEQDAARVAEQVIRAPEQSGREHGSLQTERVQATDRDEIAAPPIVHEVTRSSGQPLDPATRAYMEPRFDRDFSHVRVHTGGRPAECARALSARAFTVGEHIVFADHESAQNTGAGRRLLAHELAHVIQQEGSPPVLQRQPQDVDDLLREAMETVESVEDIRRQLGKGKEYLEILRWHLAMQGQKLPLAGSPVSKSTTPFFVEALIETSAFLEPYVLGRLVKTSVADRFTIYDFRESFETARDKLDRRVSPAGGPAPKTIPYGFYHRRTDSIHLPREARFSHALHEGIHKYSSVVLQKSFGVFLNEGVTQYFTDRVLAEHPELGTSSHAYEQELNCTHVVLRWINNDVPMLARAYFGGEVNPLAAEVRRRLGVTALQFDQLKGDREGLGLCERILDAP